MTTQITAAEETIVLPAGEEIGPFFTDTAMPDLHVKKIEKNLYLKLKDRSAKSERNTLV